MAHKVIWSTPALNDVEGIAAFIARDSERYAASVVQRIIEAVELAAEFPTMGRRVPELRNDAIREVLVHSYRILYHVHTEDIKLLAVIHGARRLRAALGDRPLD
jgi:plasmid stabilization system protein ParE